MLGSLISSGFGPWRPALMGATSGTPSSSEALGLSSSLAMPLASSRTSWVLR